MISRFRFDVSTSRRAVHLRRALSAAALASVAWMPASALAEGHGPHWSYDAHGHGGPAHWAELDPKFEACAQGQRQSPIDIRQAVKADLPALEFDYPALSPSWVNNGHTIQLNFGEGASLKVGDRDFKLLQFHFHSPSEEAINGKRLDMVAHFVHRDAQHKLGVVAVLFKRGKPSPAWDGVMAHLPRPHETITVANAQLDLKALLPADLGYYSFDGSLTTPPCSEGVSWMVLKTPVTLSGQQLAAFRKLYSGNARPLQPANDRTIKESK